MKKVRLFHWMYCGPVRFRTGVLPNITGSLPIEMRGHIAPQRFPGLCSAPGFPGVKRKERFPLSWVWCGCSPTAQRFYLNISAILLSIDFPSL